MQNKSTYNDQFKDDVIGMLRILLEKTSDHDKRFDRLETQFTEMKSEFAEMRIQVERLEKKVELIELQLRENTIALGVLRKELILVKEKLRILSGQFSDVGSMSIKDHQRISALENKVAELESRIY